MPPAVGTAMPRGMVMQVLALERRLEQKERLSAEISRWQSPEVPLVIRGLLIVGSVAVTCAVWACALLSSRCFADFALHPDYRTQVDRSLDGYWLNIIKPPGWVVLGLAVLAQSINLETLATCWQSTWNPSAVPVGICWHHLHRSLRQV